MIPLKQQDLLKQRFARDLQNRVRVDFFGQKPQVVFIPGRADNSAASQEVRKLLQELAALDLRIGLTTHDIDDDAALAAEMGVGRAPAIVLRGAANRPVRYFGNPRARQFAAFVEMLVGVSRSKPALDEDTGKTLRRLKSDVALKVFVTPTCAHSMVAMLTTLMFALESPHVRLDIYDVTQSPDLIAPFYVRATPMTVFNDQFAIPGVIEEANLAKNVLLTAQGQEPNLGGDAKRLTPLAPPQPRPKPAAGPQTTPGGLIIPR